MPSNENFTLSEEVLAQIRNTDPEAAARIRQAMTSESIRDSFDPVRQAVPQFEASSVDPYAPTSWGQPIEQDFTCSSGQTCRVRRVDIMDLLGSGMLNNLDFVTKIVEEEHIPNASVMPKPAEKSAISMLQNSDPAQMAEFKKSINAVVLRIVLRPSLWPVPEEGEARVDGCVYVDSVPFNDRVELFNWAVTGGKSAEDVQQFRPEANESVGAVEHGSVVSTETVELPQPVESD